MDHSEISAQFSHCGPLGYILLLLLLLLRIQLLKYSLTVQCGSVCLIRYVTLSPCYMSYVVLCSSNFPIQKRLSLGTSIHP